MVRPRKELDWVIDWLKGVLSSGPRLVTDIKSRTQCSWRTTEHAKQILGVRSRKVDGQWLWYIPTSDAQPRHADVAIVDATEAIEPVYEDDYEEPPFNTKNMISSARHMHLNQHENEPAIIRSIIKDCKAYPNKPPYPESYIRAIVNHVVTGAAKPLLPDGITED